MKKASYILLTTAVLSMMIMGGCKRKKSRKKAAPSATNKAMIAEEEQKLRELEDEFRKHRQVIEEKRQQLAKARAELNRMAKTVNKDDKEAWEAYQHKVQEVQRLSKEVDDLSKDFDNKWEKWHKQTNAVLQKLQVVANTVHSADVREEVARRERLVALREKEIAQREKDLAKREKEIAEREKEIAKREKELAKGCASFSMPAITIPTVVGGGGASAVSKSEAAAPIRRAEAIMANKGIRLGDLGPDAAKAYREAKKALRKKEYYKAKLIGQRFLAVVKAVRVDRGFVGAKLARINALFTRKRSKLGKAKEEKILNLLQKTMNVYNDGNFRKANTYLNRILSLL